MNLKNFEQTMKQSGYRVSRHMQGTRLAYFELNKDGIPILVPFHKVYKANREEILKECNEYFNLARTYGQTKNHLI